MASRYWVGGSASWDGTAGTKWATTSGGVGGAAVPTSADDVFFDAASGAVTVTITGATAACKNLNCTGFSGTIAGSAFTVECYGDFVLNSSMGFTSTNPLTFYTNTGTFSIDTQGKTIGGAITLNSSATRQLISALTCSSSITINSGTFTTNNYAVTADSLSSSNTNTRTINLGSSTVTLSGSGASVWNTGTTTGLTFNAGTSSVVLSNAASSITLAGGGLTFYNVTASGASTGQWAITGANTFNNLSVTAPASAGVRQVTFDSRQTINRTLSTSSTAGNRRVWFRGVTYGIAQTLTINSAPSLTDADFRDIYVIGSAAPISGTRIGDLRGCRGITFDAPKTVYWVTAGGGSWSGTNWSNTAGGAASTDYFPLAQDTATFVNTGLNTSATVTMDALLFNTGSVDLSGRTNAMTLTSPTVYNIYGDWKNGSGVTLAGSIGGIYSGRNTQTITSAGKTFPGAVTIDSYGGTVQLADALNIGSNTLTVTNGTFDTKNYNVTAGSLSSSNSNVRAINLGSSTVTLSSTVAVVLTTSTNLTFASGTSQITASNIGGDTTVLNSGGLQFYNFTITTLATPLITITGVNTFNNLTLSAPSAAGIQQYIFSANQTITGTLTATGATAVRRVFLRSSAVGTTRTLTVNTLAADDCDFRDITIAGTAAGSSPTRAGDCGGNTGITFPAPKTVYWNLSGAQNWSATGWATSSGGTPALNNFPLAQDTAVFDNTGSVTGALSIGAAWNIGTFDASARTSAMVVNLADCQVYGNWKHGTGLTFSAQNAGVDFFKNGGTQTITSNGVSFGGNRLRPGAVNFGKVVLMDAFTSSGVLQHGGGEFDANGFNVTVGGYESTNTVNTRILRMGGGLWTLTGANSVWSLNAASTFTLYKSTSDILLSSTSTTARDFTGSGLSYNKLTIGGTTGTSTFTFNDSNQFTELASTKTVAHTIALGTTTQTFGKWSVSGTVGNVVTVTGTATITIAGARVSGVDYLAMGTTAVSNTSPGEFYAGANSTGTGANIIKTAAPAAVTRYWVGGTGTWDATTTTKWSDTSGGAGGFSVPTSADAVVFDSASNATAYTVTCTATQLRCASLTMAGPASGNVTWAGTAPLAIHDNVSLSATGITRSYTGAITLSGSTTGKTFTTNGVALASALTVNGVGCEWTLGSAIDVGTSNLTVSNGSFVSSGYSIACQQLISTNTNTRSISLGSSTITIADSLSFTTPTNLSFSCGTSQINMNGAASTLNSGDQTFYNVSYTATNTGGTVVITGSATFNNLSKVGLSAAGITVLEIRANQTINGTFTVSAGSNATMRNFVRSDVLGTTRTLTCAAFSGTDADFRDTTIAGAAAPVSGTRLGDCKGNSGITFDAPKTVYYRNTAGNWGATTWSFTNNGTADVTAFPLAQDTAVFPSSPVPYPSAGGTCTSAISYNIGTIDMSARTSNTMTLATSTSTPAIYGNWINGTGTTLTGTGDLTFAGRINQTITSAGKTFTQGIRTNTPSGAVTLQDAFLCSSSIFAVTQGTFDANGFNVTLSAAGSSVASSTTTVRTIAVGSGTWTIAGTTPWSASTSTNLTVTGTGTISLTSASAKTFAGGGISYSGITLDQGGAGALTITGNNTFKNITNSYSATGATTIAMGTTTQTVTQFTATGTAGKVLTVQGSSASSPATLILTSGAVTAPDYLAITGVRAYSLTDTWYAGNNSTNNGSLGWIFAAGVVVLGYLGNFFAFF